MAAGYPFQLYCGDKQVIHPPDRTAYCQLMHSCCPVVHACTTLLLCMQGETAASYDVTSNIERSKHLDDDQQAKIYKAEVRQIDRLAGWTCTWQGP